MEDLEVTQLDLAALTGDDQQGAPPNPNPGEAEDAIQKAMLEAIVYVTDEPLTAQQIAAALAQPLDRIKRLLDELVVEYNKPEHGLSIREVAGGYKMATKAEHHEAVRAFVKKLTPPLKLSLAALETLAVVAYKQPVTAPEIMEIRGVQGAGVLKTLLDRKLITESGRKKVIGQPILYKTTKDFLVQFGLKDLAELPTLKEFEELGRLELVEEIAEAVEAGEAPPMEEVDQPEPSTAEPVEATDNTAEEPVAESADETASGH
ncbi:MAG: SMC-Scp complex subunit ScpB [Acidobacteriota bacterium]